MYTLYYTTRSYTTESTALIPRIALEETAAGYDVAEVELEPTPPDWYLAINPHGKIPTLVDQRRQWDRQLIVYPSSAILFHLARNHPDAMLLPTSEVAKAEVYKAMFDMAEMLQSVYMLFFYPERYSTDRSGIPSIRRKAVQWLAEYWRRIDDMLGEISYPAGNQYTICDIYLYVMARWYVDIYNTMQGDGLVPFQDLQHAAASCTLTEARPAVASSLAADNIEFIMDQG